MVRWSQDSANARFGEHRLAVLALPDVVLLDLAVPLQVFGPWPEYLEADGLVSPYRVELVGAGVHGPLYITDPLPLERLSLADTVIVPGVRDPAVPPPAAAVDALRAAHERGARMVSICTGAFALAAAGVLDGRRATTHWKWAPMLRARHPLLHVVDGDLFVRDGDLITSAGVLAGADLCLDIIGSDLGHRARNALARFLVSAPQREGGQAQFIDEPPGRQNELARTTAWILTHLDDPLTVESIAAQSHMSVRTLSRRFHAVLGVPVMTWVARQRVSRAREMLETTDRPVSDIAFSCGFGSVESLRVHFARHARTSPSRYRAAFG